MVSWDAVGVAHGMARSHDKTIEKLDGWIAYAKKLEGNLATMQSQAVAKEALISGLIAQVNALHANLQAVDPGNRLLQKTTVKYQSGEHAGKLKSNLRIVFEQAHDAAAKKMGISNPVEVRDN